MFSQVYYLLRSRTDGSYLVARPDKGNADSEATKTGYLLLFREQFEALSYLNKYGPDVSDRFAVESIPGSQLKPLIDRWGFAGLGIVRDPLLPAVEFLAIG